MLIIQPLANARVYLGWWLSLAIVDTIPIRLGSREVARGRSVEVWQLSPESFFT